MRRLSIGLAVTFCIVSAIALTLSFQRDFIAGSLQLLVAGLLGWGLYAQLPMGYSVKTNGVEIRKILGRKMVDFGTIASVELKGTNTSWFGKMIKCREVILRFTSSEQIVLYPSESEDFFPVLQDAWQRSRPAQS